MNKLLLAVLTIAFSINISSLIAQPRLKFDKTEHNFGDVEDGTFPTYFFKFKNAGNKELKLKNVQSSCGCTSPSWPREPIAAGDSGEIKVVFNTRGYKNKDFIKSVMIYSNAITNGKKRPHALLIKGHVVPKNAIPQYPLKTSIRYHNFKYIKQGKKAKQTIILYNNGDSVISINSVENIKGYDIDFSFKPQIIQPKDSAEIKITFNTKLLEPAEYEDRIRIITNLNPKATRILSKKGILIEAEVISKEKAKELKKQKN